MNSRAVPRVKGWSTLLALKFAHNPIQLITGLQETYGDIFYKKFLGSRHYFLCHPKYAEYILATNQDNYQKHPLIAATFTDFIGEDSLFISNNETQWNKDRKLANNQFDSTLYFKDFALTIAKKGEKVFDSWLDKAQSNSILVPLSREMDKLVLSTIRDTVFDHIDIDIEGMVDHLPVIFNTIRDKALCPSSLPYILPTKRKKHFYNEVNFVRKISKKIIHSRIKEGCDYDDLLGQYMHSYPIDQDPKNIDIIDHHVITFNVIGYTTTTSALRSLLLMLVQNKHCEEAILQEINQVCPNRKPTFMDFPKLKYTQAFVNEVLRLYPPIVFLMRRALEDDILIDYPIKAHSCFFVNIFNIHHHKDFWENPNQFNPERFLKKICGQDERFAFIPFGAGKRNCIGQNFAFLAITLIMISLVQRFRITLPDDFKEEWGFVASAFYRPNVTDMWLHPRK